MRAQVGRSEDKKLLQTLSDSLKTSYRRIKLDECGDWNIKGIKGHIFTDGKFWYVFMNSDSTRKWINIKRALRFMEVTQDGDTEGILRQEKMPTIYEAKNIRKVLGLRRRTELTEAEREQVRIRFKAPVKEGFPAPGLI